MRDIREGNTDLPPEQISADGREVSPGELHVVGAGGSRMVAGQGQTLWRRCAVQLGKKITLYKHQSLII